MNPDAQHTTARRGTGVPPVSGQRGRCARAAISPPRFLVPMHAQKRKAALQETQRRAGFPPVQRARQRERRRLASVSPAEASWKPALHGRPQHITGGPA